MPPPEGIGDWEGLSLFREGHWDRISGCITEDRRVIFPPEADRFRAFRLTQPDNVKVVIFGQDPYYQTLADGRPKADGLAFSIRGGMREREDSLSKIFRSLNDENQLERANCDLTDWAESGVLLLNRFLTVPQDQAEGHSEIWETGEYKLYEDVLRFLRDREVNFGTILMGAQDFRRNAREIVRPNERRPVYESWHPTSRKSEDDALHIYNVRPFQQINEWLRERGEREIAWQGR